MFSSVVAGQTILIAKATISHRLIIGTCVSKLLNHLGGSAKKYCRLCMADRDASFSTLDIYRKDDIELSIADGSDSFSTNRTITSRSPYIVWCVSHIAYCDFFDPTEANAWQQICIDFVHSVRTFMPKLLHKQKVRYLLHLVERMKNYGPSSTFSAELNKQAPSRDNANHFAIVEHLHYICNGCYYDSNERCIKGLQDLYSSDQVQSF
ncbi:hypothetical protein EMCRGX_G034624 [Ephydatia muelleri]